MRPRDVRSDNDLIKMRSDNFPPDATKWSILNSEDHVSLFPPVEEGQKNYTHFSIPRKEFNAIVDWYMRDQAKPKEPAA